MKDCRRAQSLLLRTVDGKVGLNEGLWLERHLASCTDCELWKRRQDRLEKSLSLCPNTPHEKLDLARSVALVREKITGLPREAAVPRRGSPGKLTVALAASVLLALGSLVFSTRPPAASVETSDADALDFARLDEVRTTIRSIVRDTACAFPCQANREEALAMAAALDEALHSFHESSWPLVPLIGGLVQDADEIVARGALRYLGLRGDPAVVEKLRAAMDDERLGVDAVLALGDVGEKGCAALAQALHQSDLRQPAARELAQIGSAEAIRILEREAVHAPELVDTLATLNGKAVPSLLRLRAAGLAEETLLLAMERIAGAKEELARMALSGGAGFDGPFFMKVVTRLGVREASPYLGAMALRVETRGQALNGLASLGGAEPLRTLLDLRETGRLAPESIEKAMGEAIQRDAEGASALAKETIEAKDLRRTVSLLHTLVDMKHAAAAPALAFIAGAELVPIEERILAALELAKVGDKKHGDSMASLLPSLSQGQQRLAAAFVFSIGKIGGESAALRSVEQLTPQASRELRRLLRSIGSERNELLVLSKLTRELKELLSTKGLEWRS